MMTDPIADMLTCIRNAVRIERPRVEMPLSKVKRGLAEVLKREGYIWDWSEEQEEGAPSKQLSIELKYGPNGERVIRHIKRSASRAAACTARPTACARAQRLGNFDHQHQPRRDQRPRSPPEETWAAKCCAKFGRRAVSYQLLAVSQSGWLKLKLKLRAQIMSRIGKKPIPVPAALK